MDPRQGRGEEDGGSSIISRLRNVRNGAVTAWRLYRCPLRWDCGTPPALFDTQWYRIRLDFGPRAVGGGVVAKTTAAAAAATAVTVNNQLQGIAVAASCNGKTDRDGVQAAPAHERGSDMFYQRVMSHAVLSTHQMNDWPRQCSSSSSSTAAVMAPTQLTA